MNQKILKIITILMIIATLTMANFILLCADVVSYAAEISNIEKGTNNKNVEFVAYFKNEKGEKINSLNAKTNAEDLKMYFQVSVKQEGYFNGNILLKDANFKFKSGNTNTTINKIEDNKIYLNQINAGETREIEVEIQLLEDEQFDLSLINKVNNIGLEGIYKNSTQRDISISATRKLTVDMVVPYNTESESINLSQELITNKVAKYNGVNKRIIQVELKTGIVNNLFPIKTTSIKVQTPKILNKEPEIKVSANELLTTNGKNLIEENYKYDKDTGLLEIDVQNIAENNKVSWLKNGEDKFIVTYIYDEDVEINGKEIVTNSKIQLYDTAKTILTATQKIQINNEETNGIITTQKIESEKGIYKGKLYSGIARDITHTTIINVNLVGIADDVTIVEENEKIEDLEIKSIYKNTIINKENVLNILGQDGELAILDAQNDEIITKINSLTNVDNNGNIVINYDGEISSIKIKTTSPKSTGNIKIQSTKTIGKISEDIVKSSNEIKTQVIGNYIENNNTIQINETNTNIQLKETDTLAQLQLNKKELSVMSTNNLEIRAILNSKNENNDLYKNPIIRIQLPTNIKSIDLNSVQLIDEEELKIESKQILDGNILEIKLTGEQTNYKDRAIEGATLIINVNITLDKKLPSSQEQIVLTCINGDKNVQVQKDINFVSYAGLVTINKMEGYDAEIINNQGNKEIILPLEQNKVSRGRTSNITDIENEIINNEENEITNIFVLGTFPTKDAIEGNNMDIAVGEISIHGIDANRVKVYYSENANATNDLKDASNAWLDKISDSKLVKRYLITIDKLAVKEGINASYNVQIPENLDYNLNARQGYVVNYTNVTSNKEVKTEYITISTPKGATLDISLKTIVGGKEVTEVKEGEIIKYAITVSNTGSEDMENVKVVANVPENTVFVNSDKFNGFIDDDIVDTEKEIGNLSDDIEDKNRKTVEFDIDKLAQGESTIKYYEVRVKKGTAKKEVTNKVQMNYGDVTKTSNEVRTKIEEAKISVLMATNGVEVNEKLKNGYNYNYWIEVKNETNESIKNVVAKINTTGDIKVTGLWYLPEDKDGSISVENDEITIKEISAGNTLDVCLSITVDMKNDSNVGNATLSATIMSDGQKYNSNEFKMDLINTSKVNMEVTSKNSGEYVKAGDKIIYNITVKNTSAEEVEEISIDNYLLNIVTINKITKNGNELSEDEYEFERQDKNGEELLTINIDSMKPEETIKYEIEVEPNVSYNNGEVVQLVNETILKKSNKTLKIVKTSHILQTEGTAGNNNEDGDDSNSSEFKYVLSGNAWIDANENGQKDSDEKLLEGITVKLLDAKTNEYVKDKHGNTIETITNSEGFYAFNKIEKGQYLVVFEYDNSLYGITVFEKEGVSKENNSNAIEKTINIDNKEIKAGVTEKINLTNNISGINIGLVPVKKYDMQLDKYISKVTVQNSKTVSKDYTDAQMVKQEISAKEVNSTTVVVEYTIRITNKGDVAGYVRKLVDYLSSDYKFSSELNNDWYQDGKDVYCTSLSDIKIEPGESREVKLTVIKEMRTNNTGLINNTAEIASSYNELGLTDINSTEGNKAKGENDMSAADIIISIKTGQVLTTVILVITTVIMLGVAIYLIRKLVINKEIM